MVKRRTWKKKAKKEFVRYYAEGCNVIDKNTQSVVHTAPSRRIARSVALSMHGEYLPPENSWR